MWNWLTNDKVRPLEEKAFKKDQQLSLSLYVAYKNEVSRAQWNNKIKEFYTSWVWLRCAVISAKCKQ